MRNKTDKTRMGFTLIELLASISILLIIVLLISNVTSQTTKIWNRGTGKTQTYDVARNAVGLLMKDSQAAITDEYFPFLSIDNNFVHGGSSNDAIYFVSSVAKRDSSSNAKDWKEICYFVASDVNGRNVLVRREGDSSVSAFVNTYSTLSAITNKIADWKKPPQPYTDCEVVIDNIYSFKVNCYNLSGSLYSGNYYSKSHNHKIPAFVEVELLTLSDNDWAVTNWMKNPYEFADYARKNGDLFATVLGFPLCER